MNNRFFRLSLFSSLLLALPLLLACGDDNDETKKPGTTTTTGNNNDPNTFSGTSLYDKISSDSELSDFAYILKRTGHDRQLSALGGYTVIAPNNAGIRKYLSDLYHDQDSTHHGMSSSSVEGLPDSLCQKIARQHLFAAAFSFAEYQTLFGRQGTVTNANGDVVKVSLLDSGRWQLNDSTFVLQADLRCENGYLHVVDRPLFSDVQYASERVVYSEDVWNSDVTLLHMLSVMYVQCTDFAEKQAVLEDLRFNTHYYLRPIDLYSQEVEEAFTAAYTAMNRINYILANVDNVLQRDPSLSLAEANAIRSQAQAARAFIYYNVAMLWGGAILLTTPFLSVDEAQAISENATLTPQQEVNEFVYNEVCQSLQNIPESFMNLRHHGFTRKSVLMLKAEIELTLGQKAAAANTLQQVNVADSILAFSDNGVAVPIYTRNHHQLLLREAEGGNDGLAEAWRTQLCHWDEDGMHLVIPYGYWAALKRLGRAQEVADCADYELLMPLPASLVGSNRHIGQNPGYLY